MTDNSDFLTRRQLTKTPENVTCDDIFRWMVMFPNGREEVFKTKSSALNYARGTHAKCEVFPVYRTLAQQQPDAEFLAALKEVIHISDRKHNAWDKVKEFIARAERKGGE